MRHTATTGGSGEFVFDAVPAGPAELPYRLINFSVLRRSIVVTDGRVTAEDAVMTLAVSADVVVTGARTFRNVADIENPAENLVGIAASSSQGTVTAAQLETRPVMRAGEVLETVPGLIISQHSGEGKANQYHLRGFNLDHGTDFATSVAGLPVNTPTGAHAHGYADISFLIPELVSNVQFKKGPYFADEGDFSAAGSASINYVNSLDRAPGLVLTPADRSTIGCMLEIREAHENDLPAILEIYNDVVATSTAIYRDEPATLEDRRSWFAARTAEGQPVLVAIDAGDVVGFAAFGGFRPWPGYRFTVEHSVHVRADRRAQGVGAALMTPLIERAAALGMHVMIAGIDADNAGSIRFHERLGFTRVAHLRQVGFKFGRWLDLVLMQRMLDSGTLRRA